MREVCLQNCHQYSNATMLPLLELASLGDDTKIEMVLFVLCHPKKPETRQVHVGLAEGFETNFTNVSETIFQ
jgi:hypothetical protein